MSFSTDFPEPEGSFPAPRSHRLPSFLEANVWGQDEATAEPEDKAGPVSKPREVQPSIPEEEQPVSFSASPTYWEDPTSAWGSEPAFKPPSVSLEEVSLTYDIPPEDPSKESNTSSLPPDESPAEIPDTFGDFSSFNNGFEEFSNDESQGADFGEFGGFTTEPVEARPETASIPEEPRNAIHCFDVDVNAEMRTILENLYGPPSEPLELDFSLSEFSGAFKEAPMSAEAQALKRRLFSPTPIDSKFSWHGSNTEAIFFGVNGVSEKAQRRYRLGALAVKPAKHPFDFRPKKAKNLPTAKKSAEFTDFKPTGLFSKTTPPKPQEGVLLTDFSGPVQSILQSMPSLSFMHIDRTPKSLFDTEANPVSEFEFAQFIGEAASKPSQPVFDLLD